MRAPEARASEGWCGSWGQANPPKLRTHTSGQQGRSWGIQARLGAYSRVLGHLQRLVWPAADWQIACWGSAAWLWAEAGLGVQVGVERDLHVCCGMWKVDAVRVLLMPASTASISTSISISFC